MLLSFFSLSLFLFFLFLQQQRGRTIARSFETYRERYGWKRFYCRELEKEKRETKKGRKQGKKRKERQKKKERGKEKKIKFKRFPIEPREAKTSSHHSRCIPRCNGNTHDKKFINFVLVFRSWGVLVDAAVEEVVRRRVPLHTHGKAGPVVPLSICSNDERMTLRRERSTDFLREARFGRSRVSRRIGTKVSANYILSRVPRERVVIAN